jgi:hypothetical protein
MDLLGGVKVLYKETVAFYSEVVMLLRSLSKRSDRAQEEICSGECFYVSELESSA